MITGFEVTVKAGEHLAESAGLYPRFDYLAVQRREEPLPLFQGLLDTVHQQFIDAVKQGRGERLRDNPQLYSGLVWTGQESVELGLIDGLGSTRYVAEELIGAEDLVDYTPRDRLLDRVFAQVGYGIGSALQDRLSLDSLGLGQGLR